MRLRTTKPFVSLLALGLCVAPLALVTSSSGALEPRIAVEGFGPIPHGDAVLARTMNATFDVTLRQDHARELAAFISSLSDPASANYHHFLTTAQFAQRFGASSATVRTVRDYFAGYGLHIGALSAGRIVLHVSGSTTDISRVFAAPVVTLRRSDGVLVPELRANATLPATLAHDVTAVAGLSALDPASTSALVPHLGTSQPALCPSAGSSTTNVANALGGFTLQQQGALYGLSAPWSSGHTGAGQTIAVYELGAYQPSDLTTYFSCYGLSPSITDVNVDGGPGAGYSNEATLDVEEVGGLAPGASILVYQGPNTNLGPTDTYQQIADDNTATVVTTSWGTCESDPNGAPNAEQPIFAQMAAQGQTVFSAAGDNGSSDCAGVVNNQLAVDDPSSQPYVTGVGGLTISSVNPLAESVWNSGSSGGAGGGGASVLWSRPSWQNAAGITTSQSMRMVPDLSVMADPQTGFIEYFSGTGSGSWGSIGGTSIGSPIMSAVTAVAAQSCGVSRLGFLNPTLYALPSNAYNDVTVGSNDIFHTGSYQAGPGYDMASGLGSPNPATFLADLCPVAFDLAKSAFSQSSTRAPTNSSVTLSAVLRDSHANPIPNAVLDVRANGTNGRVQIDADPSSEAGAGAATYSVTTDASGRASFALSASEPGIVTVTMRYKSQTVYSALVNFGAAATLPGPPTILRATALTGGIALVLKAPAKQGSSPVLRYQYSLDGGHTWTSLATRASSVRITRLVRGRAYTVQVRALNAAGPSSASGPRRVVTK